MDAPSGKDVREQQILGLMSEVLAAEAQEDEDEEEEEERANQGCPSPYVHPLDRPSKTTIEELDDDGTAPA